MNPNFITCSGCTASVKQHPQFRGWYFCVTCSILHTKPDDPNVIDVYARIVPDDEPRRLQNNA